MVLPSFLTFTLVFTVLPALALLSTRQIGTSVTLDYGTFKGVQSGSIVSFRGVRYADAPTGDRRFRAPVSPPSKNLGNVDASQFAKSCLSATATKPSSTIDEDCLFGNVYIPAGTAEDSKLPVVVFFHGGGFQGGNPRSAIPDVLFAATESPFILATFAYRLGAFGFLSGNEVASGGDLNAGMLDQRAALRWIQTYIGSFGGDNGSVTIWGQSAGAGAIMFWLVYNGGDNEGLFHRAMGDSPSLSYQPSGTDSFANTLYDQFSTNAGCSGGSRLACLRSADIRTLMNASSTALAARPDTLYAFAPVVDGVFLKERATVAFGNGNFARVPVLFGSNTDEGWDWTTTVEAPDATNKTVYAFIKGQFPQMTEETFNTAYNTYYPPSENNNSLAVVTSNMYGEARYICTARLIDGAAYDYDLKAYNYHYDNPNPNGRTEHGDDLDAFFGITAQDNQGLFAEMRLYFTSFMTNGLPVATGGTTWMTTSNSTGSPRILLHPGEIGMENIGSDLRRRCDFWRSTDQELQR